MSVRELSFPSANGRDTVKGWAYTPLDEKPRAIIQLIHGFGEHSRRYMHMIGRFQAAGFAVYADDHIGHGKTGYDSGTLGDPGTTGDKDGYLVYLKDEKTLHDMAVKDFPGAPFFVFGHSWGSMNARGYAALYGGDLKGLALCGLVSQMLGPSKYWKDPEFTRFIEEGHGSDPGDEWMGRLFMGMTSRFPAGCHPNAWIANDQRIVIDHANDPFNCFTVKAQLLYDFQRLYEFTESDDWAAKVPDVPIYMISGDQDPCGNYGEGLYHVANMLANTGHRVQTHAYSGYRHEIHNELELRDEVEDGLVAFFNGALA